MFVWKQGKNQTVMIKFCLKNLLLSKKKFNNQKMKMFEIVILLLSIASLSFAQEFSINVVTHSFKDGCF